MHVCNAVKYLSVITNNLVLGGVLHWRWDWGHISSSYNFSSAPFCAEVLWRDKLPCCSSEIPVFSRFGRSPPWVLLGFETVRVKGGFGQHFPSPQISATNIIKNYYHFFSLPAWGKLLFYCWLWTFSFWLLSLLPVWGGEGKMLWTLIRGSNLFLSGWEEHSLNWLVPNHFEWEQGPSSAGSGLHRVFSFRGKEPHVKLLSLPCWEAPEAAEQLCSSPECKGLLLPWLQWPRGRA